MKQAQPTRTRQNQAVGPIQEPPSQEEDVSEHSSPLLSLPLSLKASFETVSFNANEGVCACVYSYTPSS